MANAQQIALNLVAQLDQGNIQSQAAQMAATMSQAIEGAFEGLGERIAATILSGIRSGVQGGLEFAGGGRSAQGPAALIDPTTGRPFTASLPQVAPQAPQGPGTIAGPAPAVPAPSGQGEALARFRNGFQDNQPHGVLRDLNSGIQEARSVVAARQAGIKTDVSDDQRQRLQETQVRLQEYLREISTNFPNLVAELQKNAEAGRDLTDTEKERIRIDSEKKAADIAGATREGIGVTRQALGEAPQEGMSRQKMAGIAGAVFTAVEMLGQMPGVLRRSAGAQAESADLGGRALMRGQYEDVLAQQNIGGQDKMRQRAMVEEGAKVLGEVGLGIAGLLAAPFTGGASALVTAGSVAAVGSGVMNMMGFQSNVLGNMQGQTEAEKQRSAEFLSMTQRGRETAVGAFRGAQGAGAQELAPLMAGMGMSDVTGGMGGEAMGLRQFAITRAALSNEQFNGAMGGFARMGGVFPGGPEATQGQGPEQMARLLSQMGQGFSQAPQVAQGLVQGGMDTVTAMKTTADMFENAVAAGLDKAKVGDALVRVAARAEQMGLGGGGIAQENQQFATGLAQNLFGKDIRGPQQEFAEQQTAFYSRGSERGLDLTMGIRGVRDAFKNMGIQRPGGVRGQELELMLARQQVDPEGLKQLEGLFPKETKGFQGHEDELAKEIMASRRFQMAKFPTTMSPAGEIAGAMGTVAAGAPLSQFTTAMRSQQDVISSRGHITQGISVETDPSKIRMPSAEQMNAQQQMRETAVTTAAADAEIVSTGLNTLAKQLPALNTAFQNLLSTINGQLPAGQQIKSPLPNAPNVPAGGQPIDLMKSIFGVGGSNNMPFDRTIGSSPGGS